ncbi:MAG: dephospho-CoA kinase [bacterium]|nr:dephospho-CoA kinase [bacterium]
MGQTATFNQAQMQLLDMMSFVKTPEALSDLNKVISDYFARKADEEMNKLWDEGFLNDEKIEQFRHLHERTPYNKPTLK